MRPVTGAPRSVIHDPPPATHVLLLADRNLPPGGKGAQATRAMGVIGADRAFLSAFPRRESNCGARGQHRAERSIKWPVVAWCDVDSKCLPIDCPASPIRRADALRDRNFPIRFGPSARDARAVSMRAVPRVSQTMADDVFRGEARRAHLDKHEIDTCRLARTARTVAPDAARLYGDRRRGGGRDRHDVHLRGDPARQPRRRLRARAARRAQHAADDRARRHARLSAVRPHARASPRSSAIAGSRRCPPACAARSCSIPRRPPTRPA
ncbi:diguanylate cyclase domain protein [Burkholderia pseudomallei HBPUB10303a]|nr:diguanylate cyclase domain protein [Burkholderia pseudomallei HBPUB10303a]